MSNAAERDALVEAGAQALLARRELKLEDLTDKAREHYLEDVRAVLAAADAAQGGEAVAWLVLDKQGSLMHAAAWQEAAHEHINDAINEHGLTEAAEWVVRPVYAHPAPAPAVPEGYALVPVEPTPEMLWALFRLFVGELTARDRKAYAAMLSAAPKPGALPCARCDTPGACREKGTGEFCPAPQEAAPKPEAVAGKENGNG